jgi:hypothetical protein
MRDEFSPIPRVATARDYLSFISGGLWLAENAHPWIRCPIHHPVGMLKGLK